MTLNGADTDRPIFRPSLTRRDAIDRVSHFRAGLLARPFGGGPLTPAELPYLDALILDLSNLMGVLQAEERRLTKLDYRAVVSEEALSNIGEALSGPGRPFDDAELHDLEQMAGGPFISISDVCRYLSPEGGDDDESLRQAVREVIWGQLTTPAAYACGFEDSEGGLRCQMRPGHAGLHRATFPDGSGTFEWGGR